MERALPLKIYQLVVLVDTTNWYIYRDTAHCRKKIFFSNSKNGRFQSGNFAFFHFLTGHISVNNKVLWTNKPSETFKITPRTHLKHPKKENFLFFGLWSLQTKISNLFRWSKSWFFQIWKKNLSPPDSHAAVLLPVFSTLLPTGAIVLFLLVSFLRYAHFQIKIRGFSWF